MTVAAHPLDTALSLFCDGGVIERNPSPIGGTWAWCAVDAHDQLVGEAAGVIPATGRPITNNHAEFRALVEALEALPLGWSGAVCSDSKVTLGRMFWGWRMLDLPTALIMRGARARHGLGALTPVLLGGHPTRAQLAEGRNANGIPVSRWNVYVDKRCGEVGRAYLQEHAQYAV